jgi:hypothetical protein
MALERMACLAYDASRHSKTRQRSAPRVGRRILMNLSFDLLAFNTYNIRAMEVLLCKKN